MLRAVDIFLFLSVEGLSVEITQLLLLHPLGGPLLL